VGHHKTKPSQTSNVRMKIFWDIVPCSLIELNQCFRVCILPPSSGWWLRQHTPLKHQSTSTRLQGTISQKTVILVLTAVRTCNLTKFPFELLLYVVSTKQSGVAVTLWTCTWEVTGFNFNQVMDYSDRLLWFYSVSPGKCWYSPLKDVMTTSF
jgi:hypothetical protein